MIGNIAAQMNAIVGKSRSLGTIYGNNEKQLALASQGTPSLSANLEPGSADSMAQQAKMAGIAQQGKELELSSAMANTNKQAYEAIEDSARAASQRENDFRRRMIENGALG